MKDQTFKHDSPYQFDTSENGVTYIWRGNVVVAVLSRGELETLLARAHSAKRTGRELITVGTVHRTSPTVAA